MASSGADDATQTTGAAQPIWTAARQNGKAGLVFDGNDYLQTAAFGVAISQPNTIFCAGKSTNGATDYRTFIGSANQQLRIAALTTGFIHIWAGAQLTSAVNAGTATTLLMGLYNGANSEIWRDGGSITSGNAGANTLEAVYIGTHSTVQYMLTGNIYVAAVFSATLSTAQRQAVENLLNSYFQIY